MVSQELAKRGDSAGTLYVWSLKDGYCNVRISGSETIIYSVKYDTTSTL
jgi:hypothetical protein